MVARLWPRIQAALLIISLVAIAFLLRSQWGELRAVRWRLDPLLFAAASALLLLTWTLEIEIWRRLLAFLDRTLPFWATIRMWFLSAVVRYVPGNVWQPISLTAYAARRGVRPEATLTGIVFYQAVTLLGTVPFAILYLYGMNQPDHQPSALPAGIGSAAPALIVLLVLSLVLLLMRPQWLVILLNWSLARIGRPPIAAHLDGYRFAGLTAAMAFDWLLWGATFALVTFSLNESATAEWQRLLFPLIIAYPLAYVAGFLSFITPSGFGVREGALYLLLAPTMDGAVVAVSALAMRVLALIGELLIALVSFAVERNEGLQPEPTAAQSGSLDLPLEQDLRSKPT
jgi:uncharacterized membrane protein YbhN (UPF0104 family)